MAVASFVTSARSLESSSRASLQQPSRSSSRKSLQAPKPVQGLHGHGRVSLQTRTGGRALTTYASSSPNLGNDDAKEPLQMVEAVIETPEDSVDSQNSTDDVDNPCTVVPEEEKPPPRTLNGFAVRSLAGLALGVTGAFFVGMGGRWYAVLVALVSYQCMGEYYNLIKGMKFKGGKRPPLPLRKTSGLACLAMVLGTYSGIRSGLFEVMTFIMLTSMVLFRREKKKIRFSSITTLVFGLFYCGYLPSFWIRIRELAIPTTVYIPGIVQAVLDFCTTGVFSVVIPAAKTISMNAGLLCTVLPIMCIIAADTFAFLGGRTFGRTPLIAISPKKTVEGAICGLIGSVTVATACNFIFAWPGNLFASVGLGVMTFLSSVFGDLIESSLKREAAMKDSGDLIPGHGGLLDRFDSYIFTGVLVYFFWYWFFMVTGNPVSPLRIALRPIL